MNLYFVPFVLFHDVFTTRGEDTFLLGTFLLGVSLKIGASGLVTILKISLHDSFSSLPHPVDLLSSKNEFLEFSSPEFNIES